jgi:hypothetical protein
MDVKVGQPQSLQRSRSRPGQSDIIAALTLNRSVPGGDDVVIL